MENWNLTMRWMMTPLSPMHARSGEVVWTLDILCYVCKSEIGRTKSRRPNIKFVMEGLSFPNNASWASSWWNSLQLSRTFRRAEMTLSTPLKRIRILIAWRRERWVAKKGVITLKSKGIKKTFLQKSIALVNLEGHFSHVSPWTVSLIMSFPSPSGGDFVHRKPEKCQIFHTFVSALFPRQNWQREKRSTNC